MAPTAMGANGRQASQGIELTIFHKVRGLEADNVDIHLRFLRHELRLGDAILTFNYDPVLEVTGGGKESSATHGEALRVGGKTDSGDNRLETFARGGRMTSSQAVSCAPAFVFHIGDRYYSVVTAPVRPRGVPLPLHERAPDRGREIACARDRAAADAASGRPAPERAGLGCAGTGTAPDLYAFPPQRG